MTQTVFYADDDLGFTRYSTKDGETSALTSRVLASLCGVSVSTIEHLLLRLYDPRYHLGIPDTLKYLTGDLAFITYPYSMEGYDSEPPKLIRSGACLAIIYFFGHESRGATEIARQSLDSLAFLGINAGLKKKNTMYVPDFQQLETLPDPFILKDFFSWMGVTDTKIKQKFAHFLHNYYRSNMEFKYKKSFYHQHKKIAGTNAYAVEILPMIESAWYSFVLTECKP